MTDRDADLAALLATHARRIAEYRAGMKPHILAILEGPHAMSSGDLPTVADHIMDALTREGFVCAGPTVERERGRADRAEAAAAGMRAALERAKTAMYNLSIADAAGRGSRETHAGDAAWADLNDAQWAVGAALADPSGARVAAVVSAAEKWREWRAKIFDGSGDPSSGAYIREMRDTEQAICDTVDALHAERGTT